MWRFRLPYGTLTFSGNNVYQANVERLTVVTVAGTNFGGMFQYRLFAADGLLSTAAGTNFTTCSGCYSFSRSRR